MERVGCSFAKKRDGVLRLLFDARGTNRMCSQPPRSRHAVPGALGRLLAEDEASAVDLGKLRHRAGGPCEEAEKAWGPVDPLRLQLRPYRRVSPDQARAHCMLL